MKNILFLAVLMLLIASYSNTNGVYAFGRANLDSYAPSNNTNVIYTCRANPSCH